jgi:hypothetical protein
MLSTSQSSYFLDKTPANALVLPFLLRLYPDAKYVVLTRHPLAVFSSYANSFFNGDWRGAHAFNPILERYVPAMAAFLRERSAPLLHVTYEDLVTQPSEQLERVFAFLGVENDPDAVEYGKAAPAKRGLGDPINVNREARPVADKIDNWAAELAHDAEKRELAEQMIEGIDPADLEAWQWPSEALWSPIEDAGGAPAPKPARNSYTFQRRVMLALKRDIHSRPHGKLVKRVKYYCDVLLRD